LLSGGDHMADTAIVIEGVEELLRKLDAATADATLRRPMQRAVFALQADVAKYPAQYAGHPAFHFVSERQRRWFFAALRQGRIQVPYRRTGTLGRSWTTKIEGFAGEMRGIVGNVREYARWVQDRERQYYLHAGRWPTIQDVVEKRKDQIVEDFRRAVEEALGG